MVKKKNALINLANAKLRTLILNKGRGKLKIKYKITKIHVLDFTADQFQKGIVAMAQKISCDRYLEFWIRCLFLLD